MGGRDPRRALRSSRTMFPGSDHLMLYHLVVRGAAWIAVPGEESLQLAAGDIIVLPHGDAHTLSSAPGMRSQPDMSLYRPPADRQLPVRVTMGDPRQRGDRGSCAASSAAIARPYNPLLDGAAAADPRAMPSRAAARDLRAHRAGGVAAAAAGRPDRARTPERAHVRRRGAALSRGRCRPTRAAGSRACAIRTSGARSPRCTASRRSGWTIESLAQRVRRCRARRSPSASRSSSASRRCSTSPTGACSSPRSSCAAAPTSVAVIANRVGYESEAAFSRAFKKAAGAAPSAWRQRAAAAAAGD